MSDRTPYSFSNRSLLTNASETDLKSEDEAVLLAEYKSIVAEIYSDTETLSTASNMLKQLKNSNAQNMSCAQNALNRTMSQARLQINKNDNKLLELENNPILKNVLEREKEKAYKAAEERGRQALAKQCEQDKQRNAETQVRLLEAYHARQEELQKKRAIEKDAIQKALQEKELKEKREKKKEVLETIVSWARVVTIALCMILIFSLSWLSQDVFSHQVLKETTVKERYEYVIGEVATYVCYTTDYGDCYHAYGCNSLWKSSYKTTVYSAQKRGYSPCSKCTPNVPTTETLKDYGYKDVTHSEYVTEPASKWLIWFVGTGCIVVAYLIPSAIIKSIIKKAEARKELISTE